MFAHNVQICAKFCCKNFNDVYQVFRILISGYWPTSEPNAGYSDAMTSRLPRYDAKCVQRRCFQWGSVPLRVS